MSWNRKKARVLALALTVLVLWVPIRNVAASSPPFAEYAVPTSNPNLTGVTGGPDGNIWFTEQATNKIGKITPTGTITEYVVPTNGSFPASIITGPDGNLWFEEYHGLKIAKVTTSGAFTEYPMPITAYASGGMTIGSDGNIWFLDSYDNKIGKITMSGTITLYDCPTASSNMSGIVTGPDGNVWFTELAGNKVGEITPSGTITEFTVPTSTSQPGSIALGSDGNLWFTEFAVSKVGKITTSGTITEYGSLAHPTSIIPAPDGNLYYYGRNALAIQEITTSDVVVTTYTPATLAYIEVLSNEPGGNLLFVEHGGNSVGKLMLAPHYGTTPLSLPVTNAALSLSSAPAISGGSVTLTGAAQTITAALPVTVTDARGSGVGWTLTLAAADLKNASNNVIPFSGLALAPQTPALVDSTGSSAGALTLGSSGNLSGSDTSPGTTLSSAFTLLTALSNGGMGMYNQTENITLTIPSNVYTGAYTTSLNLTAQ